MPQWTPAGQFRHPVEVQANTPTRDAIGGQVDGWATVYRTRAKITPLTGRRFVAAQQAQSEQTHQVNLRYWAPLTVRHRILFNGRVLSIVAAMNKEECNREWELVCSEGTP